MEQPEKVEALLLRQAPHEKGTILVWETGTLNTLTQKSVLNS